MSLIIDIKHVEREIGQKRAAVVREFRQLVDERRYPDAERFYREKAESGLAEKDLRLYANLHLREMKNSHL